MSEDQTQAPYPAAASTMQITYPNYSSSNNSPAYPSLTSSLFSLSLLITAKKAARSSPILILDNSILDIHLNPM